MTEDQNNAIRATATRVLQTEGAAVSAMANALPADFADAVSAILATRGRVILSGIGKSGHIARKISSTFASTGTPSAFVHPAEASHGDLGMVMPGDLTILISNSGETAELRDMVAHVARFAIPMVAISGRADSTLMRAADYRLLLPPAPEACVIGMAPTTSTTLTLALGDALAVATLQARGFNQEDFARAHPGGALGRRLITRVRDVMRHGSALPTVAEDASVAQALMEISKKGMGMTAVVDQTGRAVGIFTDGDLRRLIEAQGDIRQVPIKIGMSPSPQHISPDVLAVQAASIMDERRISQLLVANESGQLVGALHMHDLMTAKVI